MYLLGKGWKKKQQQFEETEGQDAGQVHTFIGIGSSEQEMQQLHLDGKVTQLSYKPTGCRNYCGK